MKDEQFAGLLETPDRIEKLLERLVEGQESISSDISSISTDISLISKQIMLKD
jgi:hypothetical protein